MASYFQFLVAFILLTGIQGGVVVPSPPFLVGDNENLQTIDMNVFLKRFDQMEAKLEQHEMKITSQQRENDQLKKKNSDLEEKNHQSILAGAIKERHDEISRSSSLPRSCFEHKATINPGAQSGVFTIDPDGQTGGDPPIQVYCDMKTLTTSIYHDTEAKTAVTSCADPGCYTKAITYSATMRQLVMLADVSASCQQSFKFDSTGVPLGYNNEQYGYWHDRNDEKQIFWAGPATSQHTCQCGISKNCTGTTLKCNADSLPSIELADEGFITATELLPVTRLSFGRTNLTGAKASYTLGRFECTGQAVISSKPTNCQDLFKMGHTLSGFYDVDGGSNHISSVYCDFTKSSTETGYETRYGTPAISSKPTNCQDLFKMGHTLSGFYDVKSGSNQIASTFCDFSKASTETGYETRYGFVDIKSSSVHFFVTRTSDWSGDNTIMPFDKEYLNLGGGMNLASGVFTALKAGIYAFSFKGNGNGEGQSVYLQQNGVDVVQGYSKINNANGYTHATIAVHGTLKLAERDTIRIRLAGGSVGNIKFTGSLIEEDLVIS